MTKGSISIEVKCLKCQSSRMDVPDDTSNDPLVHCANCRNVIGPYSAIKAALEGQAHTIIMGGGYTAVTVKSID